MSSTEGRQSPPPEQQSGAQLKSAPGHGQGIDDATNKEQTNSSALDVWLSGQAIIHSLPGGLLTIHFIEPVVQPKGRPGRCRQGEVLKNFGRRGYKAEVRAQPDRACSREDG